ncbi:MAG TPA: hypothetical protein VF520_03015 [Thermoleophilaceae bacterium]|jgi:hypothetical protein
MAYGSDVTVYVEDTAGDLGAPGSPAPWWLSPDVDIPAHPGTAVQGPNDVRIRVHTQEEPILEEKIVAEVYAGDPSLVLSPTTGTQRIDPGNLRFRPPNVAGSEPVADQAGGVLTFSWTPASSATSPAGPGHRCLVLRAFPESVTPPSSPFDVPNEQHEAQHNIDVLETTTKEGSMGKGGAGSKEDPRRRLPKGLWWERVLTTAIKRRGRRIVVWAYDPSPARPIVGGIRKSIPRDRLTGFSKQPPQTVELDLGKTRGEGLDPASLFERGGFAKRAGLGDGLFAQDRVVAAAAVDLGPRTLSRLLLRFDHSNLKERTAVVLHGAQWTEDGTAEGGITIVALAPVK